MSDVTRWEYLLSEPKKWDLVEPLLNQLGSEGWECVGLAAGQFGPKLILKRPR